MKYALLLLLAPLAVFGQIKTDRPDHTDGTSIVERRSLQWESGMGYERQEDAVMWENTFRTGITKNFEVRLRINQLLNHFEDSRFQVSTKYRFLEDEGSRPAMALVGYADVPFGDYSAALATEKDLTEKISVGTNLGYHRKDELNLLLTSISFGFELSDKTSTFLEYYSEFGKGQKPDHHIDAGMMYLVKNNFQLDAGLGGSVYDFKNNWHFTVGASYLFKL